MLVLSADLMDSGAAPYLFAKVTVTSVAQSYTHADVLIVVIFKQVFSKEMR